MSGCVWPPSPHHHLSLLHLNHILASVNKGCVICTLVLLLLLPLRGKVYVRAAPALTKATSCVNPRRRVQRSRPTRLVFGALLTAQEERRQGGYPPALITCLSPAGTAAILREGMIQHEETPGLSEKAGSKRCLFHTPLPSPLIHLHYTPCLTSRYNVKYADAAHNVGNLSVFF